jgi:hypothetical protein
VDGAPALIEAANGHHMAVAVPAGACQVELRYESAAGAVGIVISLLSLAALALYAIWLGPLRSRRIQVGGSALVILLCAGLLLSWSREGEGLGTEYRWTPASGPLANAAYGKRVETSSVLPQLEPHHVSPARAVDGDTRSPGFITKNEERPYFQVDLAERTPIGRVALFEWLVDESHNRRPLTFSISQDGETWRKLLSTERGGPGAAWGIQLPSPVAARFLRIEAEGRCQLSFREVQVFAR